MSDLKDFKNMIAASIFLIPCTEEEIVKRFDDRYSSFGIQKAVQFLENDNAIYYKGNVMRVYIRWAKDNLKEYDLDLRSEKKKELDSMTDFEKALKKQGLIY